MKFYVDELPEQYFECPWAKVRGSRGGIVYCSATPNSTGCPRFNSCNDLEPKKDADPSECLCLKVLPKAAQVMRISGLEEGTWP